MYVVDHTLLYLILGLPELSKFNLTIDCSHLQIKQNGNIVNKINKYKNERKYSLHINEETYVPPPHSQISEDQNVLPQIVIDNKCELREILSHYDSIFSKDKYDVGQLRVEPQRIILKSDLPVHLRPYRTSPTQEKEIKGQVEKLLQAGLIKESNSPYSAPVTLAFKRDEGKKTRLCIDFRKLNALSKADSEPLPIMDSLLDKLARAKYFFNFRFSFQLLACTHSPKGY
ncbi:retrovirus-related Pol polyprotein from transposon 412 [Trichonephila clavipes]|nr:retrovirus-related Pol polyprotein from transposon 412 [Trichonephila clavipes]